jgi:hypothetical protein
VIDLGGARRREGRSGEVFFVVGRSCTLRGHDIVLADASGCAFMNFVDAAGGELFSFTDAGVLEAVPRLLLPSSIMPREKT